MSQLLSPEALVEIERECAKYPTNRRQSGLMAALRIAQNEHQWLNRDLINEVAEVIGVPAIRAYEVATFYSMYELQPVGKHKISVCTSISCMLRGSDEIVNRIKKRLNIDFGETTCDGQFSLKQVECLAACAGAPMLQIGHDYYENLSREKVDHILQNLS